jgi:hypothetical protein
MSAILLLGGCTTMRLMKGEEAALYSIVNAKGFIVPVSYEYSIVRRVDGKFASYSENPIFLPEGKHTIEIEHGGCFAPVLIILCEFQSSTTKTIEYTFVGGKEYTLTLNKVNIVEI